jgi:hypothetical protein
MSQASNSKRHTAFLLAIYSLAILSMEDVECEAIMAVSREGLLQAYHRATEQALAAVDVLATTDMMVLQAFVMYIVRKEKPPLQTREKYSFLTS